MKKKISNIVAVTSECLAVMSEMCSAINLKNRLKNAHLRLSRPGSKSMPSLMLILILSMSMFVSIVPFEAQAAGKDFSITSRAADPVDYPNILPGTVIAPIGSGVTLRLSILQNMETSPVIQ